ncbi:MAG: transcriptional regulator of molybdate metabolism, LysR family protein [Osedax symbiont Rs2]|nr:MAG: transcriptional regulator of molybdate metabolism, LysR family protein [Osedax symbiont Rs2]
MKRISVEPAWIFKDESGSRLDPQLFLLISAIHEQGKLTLAAKQVGISYRHSWNILRHWAGFFGCELVHLQKGRGASLTPLGEKLLWAQQRLIARLEPQLKSFASEINLEIQRSLDGVKPLLNIYASFGYAVELLPNFTQNYQLNLQYKEVEEALVALNRGQCDVAGFHLPVELRDAKYLTRYLRHLRPRAHKVIRFIPRRMGLMVKATNPKQIFSLQDMVDCEVQFINREPASGTRLLFEELLQRQDLPVESINGFDDVEYTHSAIAAYVAAGMADVGFGVEAAAKKFSLHFIPMTTEHYLFVCNNKTLQQESMQRFLAEISSVDFYSSVETLAGYTPDQCGEVINVEDL